MHNLLCTLRNEKKRKWPQLLPELVYVYSYMLHATTGYSPHFLLFGREPRLPVDGMLGTEVHPDLQEESLAEHQQ